MQILSDYHHDGLYYSQHALFEQRLGHNLFRPIGMEWFERGFFDVAKPYGNNLETIKQFLSMKETEGINGSAPLNTIVGKNPFRPFHDVYNYFYEFQHKAITFAQFLDLDIDVIVASIPDHWVTYRKLRDQFKPKAKLICHLGNIGWDSQQLIKDAGVQNLMASVLPFKTSSDINSVFYYQEQPIPEFKAKLTTTDKPKISSYVHVLPNPELFEQYKQALPEFDWRAYGAACPDGWMPSIIELYKNMQESSFVYHVKPGGDGFGWNWHSAFMNARPILTNYSDYKNKLGGLLFEDLVTGIDLEARSFNDNVKLIKDIIGDKDRLNTMQLECKKRFDQLVNYDNEQKRIEDFIAKLI